MRIGKLQNHAIANAAGTPQSLRAVSGYPDRRDSFVRPAHLNRVIFVDDLLSAVEIPNHADGVFQIFESRRFFTHDSARTVATSDAAIHAAAGDLIQRSEETCRDGGIANNR